MISFHGLLTLKMRSMSPKSSQLFPPPPPPNHLCMQVWSKSIHWFKRYRIGKKLRGRGRQRRQDPHQKQYVPHLRWGDINNMSPTFGWGDIKICIVHGHVFVMNNNIQVHTMQDNHLLINLMWLYNLIFYEIFHIKIGHPSATSRITVRQHAPIDILFDRKLTCLFTLKENIFRHQLYMSCCMRKPTIWDSDQVRHKATSIPTEEGWRLETLDLKRRQIALYIAKNKGLISCAATAQLICVFVFA